MRTYPELERRKVKHNGFCRPLHPLQLLTYGVVGLQLVTSGLVMLPTYPLEYQVTLRQVLFGVVSGGLQTLVLVLGFLVTRSDPTDPVVYEYRRELLAL